LKLQSLENEVFRIIGNLPRRMFRDFHVALKIWYINDITVKLCRQQVEIVQNHENTNIYNIWKSEAQHRNIRGLKLVAVRHTTHSVY